MAAASLVFGASVSHLAPVAVGHDVDVSATLVDRDEFRDSVGGR